MVCSCATINQETQCSLRQLLGWRECRCKPPGLVGVYNTDRLHFNGKFTNYRRMIWLIKNRQEHIILRSPLILCLSFILYVVRLPFHLWLFRTFRWVGATHTHQLTLISPIKSCYYPHNKQYVDLLDKQMLIKPDDATEMRNSWGCGDMG